MHARGPCLRRGIDDVAHLLGGRDDIGANALGDVDGDRGPPVHVGKVVASTKLRWTVATSFSLTVASRVERIGRLRTSSPFSITAGTLMAKAPWPVSSEPAGISELFWLIAVYISA